jgi:hypothetical protein
LGCQPLEVTEPEMPQQDVPRPEVPQPNEPAPLKKTVPKKTVPKKTAPKKTAPKKTEPQQAVLEKQPAGEVPADAVQAVQQAPAAAAADLDQAFIKPRARKRMQKDDTCMCVAKCMRFCPCKDQKELCSINCHPKNSKCQNVL